MDSESIIIEEDRNLSDFTEGSTDVRPTLSDTQLQYEYTIEQKPGFVFSFEGSSDLVTNETLKGFNHPCFYADLADDALTGVFKKSPFGSYIIRSVQLHYTDPGPETSAAYHFLTVWTGAEPNPLDVGATQLYASQEAVRFADYPLRLVKDENICILPMMKAAMFRSLPQLVEFAIKTGLKEYNPFPDFTFANPISETYAPITGIHFINRYKNTFFCYIGDVYPDMCEELLSGEKPGTYFIRRQRVRSLDDGCINDGSSADRMFITVKGNEMYCHHFLISCNSFRVRIEDGKVFNSLEELIKFYENNSVCPDSTCYLKHNFVKICADKTKLTLDRTKEIFDVHDSAKLVQDWGRDNRKFFGLSGYSLCRERGLLFMVVWSTYQLERLPIISVNGKLRLLLPRAHHPEFAKLKDLREYYTKHSLSHYPYWNQRIFRYQDGILDNPPQKSSFPWEKNPTSKLEIINAFRDTPTGTFAVYKLSKSDYWMSGYRRKIVLHVEGSLYVIYLFAVNTDKGNGEDGDDESEEHGVDLQHFKTLRHPCIPVLINYLMIQGLCRLSIDDVDDADFMANYWPDDFNSQKSYKVLGRLQNTWECLEFPSDFRKVTPWYVYDRRASIVLAYVKEEAEKHYAEVIQLGKHVDLLKWSEVTGFLGEVSGDAAAALLNKCADAGDGLYLTRHSVPNNPSEFPSGMYCLSVKDSSAEGGVEHYNIVRDSESLKVKFINSDKLFDTVEQLIENYFQERLPDSESVKLTQTYVSSIPENIAETGIDGVRSDLTNIEARAFLTDSNYGDYIVRHQEKTIILSVRALACVHVSILPNGPDSSLYVANIEPHMNTPEFFFKDLTSLITFYSSNSISLAPRSNVYLRQNVSKRLNEIDAGNSAEPLMRDPYGDLSRFAWYIGKANRKMAENLLADCPKGTFLLRDRESRKGAEKPISLKTVATNAKEYSDVQKYKAFESPYAICVNIEKPHHFEITVVENRGTTTREYMTLVVIGDGTSKLRKVTASSIPELISKWRQTHYFVCPIKDLKVYKLDENATEMDTSEWTLTMDGEWIIQSFIKQSTP